VNTVQTIDSLALSRGSWGRRLQLAIKRVLEWLIAATLLLLLAPFLLLLALLIKLESAGPVLFVQDRLGRNGRVFRMYKFRSLRWEPGCGPILNPDGSTRVDESDRRLTRLGRFLRIGFDELPQLWNVLKAEMALIGPRPDQPVHRRFYSHNEERKLCVLPGIAGLPQALGRNEIPWKERILLDLYYIDNYSLWLDLKVVLLTIVCVCRRNGIYAQDH
jgi:undecaprenyl phosphate N,N'-diacetylbacillosamine 1-phosphate transferase